MADPVEPGDTDGVWPFHSVAFRHAPTQDEIQRELSAFLGDNPGKGNHNVAYPGSNILPSPGYKQVVLTVKTGASTNDGTNDATKAYFLGTWLSNGASLPAYVEKLVLNYPDFDDLDTGTLNTFYYLFRLDSYVPGATADQFQRGRIGNTSTDRWRCEHIWVDEWNYTGTGRRQILNFSTSVEA